jgi:hypothetical protein
VNRPAFAAFALGTIVLGLVVHLGGDGLGPALRDVAGDALYAAMVAWLAGAAAPRTPTWRRAAAAFACCLAIEIGQLVREPHIDAIRATPLGHLALGSDFDARDIGAYAGGVGAAALLERALVRRAGR